VTEIEETLNRARRELAETKAAITEARGERVETLAKELLGVQAETTLLESKAASLDAVLAPKRLEVERKRASLAGSTPSEG
jgi:hypothetical protein